ncbi:MAG: NADH-quinone oxidoreductase subunit C, partial [Dehalococcoidia bacterium]
CRLAKEDALLRMDYLRCLAVTEYDDRYQAAYMLYSTALGHKAILKADAPKDDPVIPSVSGVWAGADWHEREGAELFGVVFSGHPALEHLLLFDEFKGKYPLRKDYPYEETTEWSLETHPRWETPDDGR